jgi:SAM-dependent methyltransferase
MGTSLWFKYHPEEKFGGKKVLNIGCGSVQFKIPNVVNVDAYESCEPDLVHNLEKMPLPFEDKSIDLIIANHIFEHLNNWWECFEECARLVKVGGHIEIWVPGDGSSSQLGYRDHVKIINTYSFYGIGDLQRPGSNAWAANQVGKITSKLTAVKHTIVPIRKWWLRKMPSWFLNFCIEHLRNVVLEEGFLFKREIE